jgi:heat shock transcription factor
MQAEQDRSVQNLTNLLQPLSPSGSIPGIGDGTSVPPPPLDIDDLLNTGDYFSNDFPPDTADYDFATNGNGFNFSTLPAVDDDALFGDVGTKEQQQEFDPFKSSPTEDGRGRVESVTSSEVTTPPNTVDTETATTRSKGQRYTDADGEKGPPKRRKRNA